MNMVLWTYEIQQDRQYMCNAKLRRVRVTTVAVEKKSITSSECESVALLIQHAMRMRRIILSSVACPAVQYFSTTIFGRTLLNMNCVF
jgi:hypothetical protein